MYKIFIFLIMLINLNQDNISVKYNLAYNYIYIDGKLKDVFQEEVFLPDKIQINIADSLVALDITFFLDDILNYEFNKIKKDKDYQSLRNKLYLKEFKKNISFMPKKNSFINNTSSCISKSDLIVFFSEFNDNKLMAEVFLASPKNKNNLKDYRKFSTSKIYLFYYNELDQITKVFTKIMNYN